MTEAGKERVGDYELLELIGDGAQGRVYKARYCGADASKLAGGDIVAIKLIHVTGDDDKLRSKFQAQADILRRLSHNNIVRYRDSFAWPWIFSRARLFPTGSRKPVPGFPGHRSRVCLNNVWQG